MPEARIAIYYAALVLFPVALISGGVALLPKVWRRRRARIILGVVALVLLLPAVVTWVWPSRLGASAPVNSGASLYVVGSDCSFYDGVTCNDPFRLYGFSGADGSQRWSQPLSGSAENDGYFTYTAHAGVVYIFQPDLPSSAYPNVTGGTLVALRGADGATIWRTPLTISASVVTYDAGRLDVFGLSAANQGAASYAAATLDATTGAAQESHIVAPSDVAPLTTSGGVLYGCETVASAQGTPNSLGAWRISDGRLLWRRVLHGGGHCFYTAASAEMSGALYLHDFDGRSLVALRAVDGALLWQTPLLTPAPTYPDAAALVTGNGLVLLAVPTYNRTPYPNGDFGRLMITALNASDGSLHWRQQLGLTPLDGSTRFFAPLIVGSTVLNGGNTLTALRLTDGAILWQHTRPNFFVTIIGVSGQVLFTHEQYQKPERSITIEEFFTLDYLDAHNLATGAPYWEANHAVHLAISDG